jgi:hypothetical protein
MPERSAWSTPLPRPIKIPQVMTLKTLADVRKLIDRFPKERRELSIWQAYAAGDDTVSVSVALKLALLAEKVPYVTE